MELTKLINGDKFLSFSGLINNRFESSFSCSSSQNPILIVKANAIYKNAFSLFLSHEKFLQTTMLVKKTGAERQKRKGAWLDTNF